MEYPYINIPVILIIWGVIIVMCFVEAYFCTELDQESKEYLNNKK